MQISKSKTITSIMEAMAYDDHENFEVLSLTEKGKTKLYMYQRYACIAYDVIKGAS